MVLQHVSSNVLSGLIETLAAPPYNGRADLPVLAGACNWKPTRSSISANPCNCCGSPN